MKYKNLISCVIALLCLSSCGFRPLYAKHNTSSVTNNTLAQIELREPTGSLDNFYLYNSLRDLLAGFDAKLDKPYLLTAHVEFNNSYNMIQPNSDVLRQNIKAIVNYRLTKKDRDLLLISGNFELFASCNSAAFPYSSLLIVQDTYKNLSISAAREILHKISIYLENHPEERRQDEATRK
jgi:hypothetical protein